MKVLQSREIFFLEKWKFNIWKLLIVQDSLKIVCKINFDFQFAARLFQSSHPFEIHFFFTLIHHFHNMSFNSGQACYVSVCYYVDFFFKQEKEKNHVIYQIFKRLTDLTIVTVAKGIGAPGLQNIFPPCLKMYLKNMHTQETNVVLRSKCWKH